MARVPGLGVGVTTVVALVLVVVRVVGGALLLSVLGAPHWAVAAWVMFHVRVRLTPPSHATGDVTLTRMKRDERSRR